MPSDSEAAVVFSIERSELRAEGELFLFCFCLSSRAKRACFASEASAARILAAHLAGCTARITLQATIHCCNSARMPDSRGMLACACELRGWRRMRTARCTMPEREHHATWRGFRRPAKTNSASSSGTPRAAQYLSIAQWPQRRILRASSVQPARIAH
jgi:hypothetical protein